MPANLENSAVATGLEKVSFHSNPIPKQGNAKECSKYQTTAVISHISKVMLKILQARLQQYMNCEIPAELFQILKDDGVKVLDSICQQIWENSTVTTGLENVSFHSNGKECSNYRTIVLISHISKVMLKILQA